MRTRLHAAPVAVNVLLLLICASVSAGPQAGPVRVYEIDRNDLDRLGFGQGWESVQSALIVASVPSGEESLRPGDVILQFRNDAIASWSDLQAAFDAAGGGAFGLSYRRGRRLDAGSMPAGGFVRGDRAEPLAEVFPFMPEMERYEIDDELSAEVGTGTVVRGSDAAALEQLRAQVAEQAAANATEASTPLPPAWEEMRDMFADLDASAFEAPADMEMEDEEDLDDPEYQDYLAYLAEVEAEAEAEFEALRGGSESERIGAVMGLTMYLEDVDRAFPALIGALGDPAVDVRRAAAVSLSEAASTDTALPERACVDALASSHSDLRRFALRSLQAAVRAAGSIGRLHRATQESVVRAALDADDGVRAEADGVLSMDPVGN